MKYRLNKGTEILHIYGYCYYSKGADLLQSRTEEDVVAHTGRPVRMCRNCAKKRDQVLNRNRGGE